MAAGATPMPTPPPGAPPTGAGAPSSPIAASPAPAQPNPNMEKASGVVIQVVQALRGLAQAIPATSQDIQQIMSIMRDIQMKIMANQHPGEPAAPPMG